MRVMKLAYFNELDIFVISTTHVLSGLQIFLTNISLALYTRVSDQENTIWQSYFSGLKYVSALMRVFD